jgi:hypothetical protein
MKRKLVLIGLSFLSFVFSEAQNYDYPSPVSSSLGMSGAGDTTVWSHFTNPSGLSSTAMPVVGVGYHNAFLSAALTSQSVFGVLPMSLINVGAGYVKFGNNLFNIQHGCLTLARTVSPRLHLGVRFEYVHRYIRNARAAGALLLDAGFRYTASEKLMLGVMVENPAQSNITGDHTQQTMPSSLAVACRAELNPWFSINADLMHRVDISQQIYAFGLSTRLHDIVEIRGALSGKPVKLSIGATLQWDGIEFNVAASHHDHLGMSSTAGIAYYFSGGKGGGL